MLPTGGIFYLYYTPKQLIINLLLTSEKTPCFMAYLFRINIY